MLFSPEAHEALADEPWNAERARRAITSIVADAERAFDDGWPLHPQDEEDESDAGARFRTLHIGGAGSAGLRRVTAGLCPVSGAFGRG